jgi:hypothetical protein
MKSWCIFTGGPWRMKLLWVFVEGLVVNENVLLVFTWGLVVDENFVGIC